MNARHLSDDEIAESCLTPDASATTAAHLDACAACHTRRARLARLLSEVSTAAGVEADAAFGDEWLARQRARILHRVEMDGRPARVIAFPAGAPRDGASRRTRPATRWVAAGAAAGLAIGLLTGQLAHRLPTLLRPDTVRAGAAAGPSAPARSGAVIRTISTVSSDDEFLAQVELAGGSGGPATLRPLDALTPRDVR